MASIDDSPSDQWLPAGQKLIFTIIPDITITDDYRFIVEVFENDTVDPIAKLYLTPNTNETAFFDLSEVVLGRVEVDIFKYGLTSTIHSLNNNVFTRANNGVKKYVVKIGHFDGSSESTAEDISANYYLLDGYEQISAGLDPGYSDYYGTSASEKFWLTDRVPSSNIIHVTAGIEDTGVFAFINTDDTSSQVGQIIAVIYDNDGVEDDSLNYVIGAPYGRAVARSRSRIKLVRDSPLCIPLPGFLYSFDKRPQRRSGRVELLRANTSKFFRSTKREQDSSHQ